MYKRFLERWVEDVLSDTPVDLIVGSSQAGKTTLVKSMEDVDCMTGG